MRSARAVSRAPETTGRAGRPSSGQALRGTGLLALNLQYCLREARIASTLVGAATPAEIEADVAAASEEIPGKLWHELREGFGL